MTTLPEDLPPKWLESMQARRPCLFRFSCDRAIPISRARTVAQGLIDEHGDGEWDCDVVQLDRSRRDWEFRFKPRLPRVKRTRLRSVPN